MPYEISSVELAVKFTAKRFHMTRRVMASIPNVAETSAAGIPDDGASRRCAKWRTGSGKR
jgi:hypothetical protein